MEITRIIVDRHNDRKLIATASVFFDDCFVVHDFRIVDTGSGVFVGMPSRPLYCKCVSCGKRLAIVTKRCPRCKQWLPEHKVKYIDVAHPLDNEFRYKLVAAILAALEEVA